MERQIANSSAKAAEDLAAATEKVKNMENASKSDAEGHESALADLRGRLQSAESEAKRLAEENERISEQLASQVQRPNTEGDLNSEKENQTGKCVKRFLGQEEDQKQQNGIHENGSSNFAREEAEAAAKKATALAEAAEAKASAMANEVADKVKLTK